MKKSNFFTTAIALTFLNFAVLAAVVVCGLKYPPLMALNHSDFIHDRERAKLASAEDNVISKVDTDYIEFLRGQNHGLMMAIMAGGVISLGNGIGWFLIRNAKRNK